MVSAAQTELIQGNFDKCIRRVETILDERRFAFAVSNVIVPTVLMSVLAALVGQGYDDSTKWIPRLIVNGGILVLWVGSAAVLAITVKCHAALARQGMFMKAMLVGRAQDGKITRRAVSTAFFSTSCLWMAAGIVSLGALNGWPVTGGIIAVVLVVAAILWFRAEQRWADAEVGSRYAEFVEKLRDAGTSEDDPEAEAPVEPAEEAPAEPAEPTAQAPAEPAEPADETRELDARTVREVVGWPRVQRHAEVSLKETSEDMNVVVIVAAALFIGCFNALANVGGLPLARDPKSKFVWDSVDVPLIRCMVTDVLPWLLVVSLVLSFNIMHRLRFAVCDYGRKVSRYPGDGAASGETDMRLTEIPLLMVAVLVALLGAALAMGAHDWWPPEFWVLYVGVPAILVGRTWYLVRAKARAPVGRDDIEPADSDNVEWWVLGLGGPPVDDAAPRAEGGRDGDAAGGS